MVNIAVLGYGTVGSGVVEVINTNHKSINKRAGAEINVKYVLDLRDFPGDPVEKVLVRDYEIIANDPEVGAIYKGKVVSIKPFGAFVEIAPGKDGLVHISKLDKNRVEQVEDVVSIGDEIIVKVMEIKDGKISLSRKDALADLEAKKKQA